jgi:hypothetical protein
MSSSSKTKKSSLKKTLSPMEKHQLSDIASYFDEELITDEYTRSCKSHRWASKSKFLADISNKLPYEILDLPLSNFGLCNISYINEIMVDESNHISYAQKAAVNELFKIKYAKKQYSDEVNEDIMRTISKTKFTKLKEKGKKNAVKNKEWEDYWGERYRLAELGISTDPSSSAAADTATATATAASTHELSLDERLARLRQGKGSKSKKRRGTRKRRKSIKRRGTKQQGGTKRRSKSRR